MFYKSICCGDLCPVFEPNGMFKNWAKALWRPRHDLLYSARVKCTCKVTLEIGIIKFRPVSISIELITSFILSVRIMGK